MGLQRTFVGTLAFITWRGQGALATPYSNFSDLVAFFQHSVKEAVFRNSDFRIDELEAGHPVSLLALDAAASAKWYETGSADEALVRKLAARRKADEEREAEQEAQAAASRASGATFLSQESGHASLARENHTTRQWLSQIHLDQMLEDEIELDELAGQLQRIAAEVDLIAKHQLDFGKSMGLPDPTVDKFEINDKVELQIGRGKNIGKWVKATISGYGPRTNTYRVHIPSAKAGSQDMSMVPAIAMRRDEEAVSEAVYEAAAMTYEEGEQAQIEISVGPNQKSWVKCVVRSKGNKPDTYNIFIAAAAAGHKDQSNVEGKRLRKVDSNQLFGQYDVDGDGELSTEEFNLALKEKATNVRAQAGNASGEDAKALYAMGEPAEVFAGANGTFVGCSVIGEGDLADSYNVFVPSFPMGFQYLPNTDVALLRKLGANKDAFEQKVNLIPPFVDHEVIAPRGNFKGRWVPCQLKSQGKHDTYTVWMPFGVLRGHNTANNVPPSAVRVRKTCGPGYDDIFNGDAPGGDNFGRESNKKETVGDCAADCNKRLECRSFEWSPSSKVCNLNRILNPTLGAFNDQMFCRRKELPSVPKTLWDGPLIGQPLEYVMMFGEHAGEWHPCVVTSFGAKPDTYSVNASIDFLGREDKYSVLPDVPLNFLRYAEDRPIASLANSWAPPQGEDAIWVNLTKAVTEHKDEEKHQSFLVTQGRLKDESMGLPFRASKKLNDTIGSGAHAAWGQYVTGVDEGDGWVRVGDTYLPTFVNNSQVLAPRIIGEPGEAVLVLQKDGLWAPATIRSRGDAAGSYNVKMLRGKAGRYLSNLPLARMRKTVSAPKVDAATRRPAATTTRPPQKPAAAGAVSTSAAAGAAPAAAARPAALAEGTTTPLPQATTAVPVANVDEVIEQFKDKLRQDFKREQEAKLKATTRSDTEQVREFFLDNRLLQHKGPGMAYRFSKRLDDSRGRDALALWGSYVSGVNEGDGWIRVEDKYLPATVKGIPVISQKVIGDVGEIVQVEQEDGSWAHGTVRSKGDWPDTFNVHVMDNGAGYELDNLPVRRLRHELEQPAERREEPAEAVVPPPGAAALLTEAGPRQAKIEQLAAVGDLGEDLPEGVFRENMTAEVKINAGPQAGSWARCRVIGLGSIADTYNLYVPSAPQEYQAMQNVPALAMRKLASTRASSASDADDAAGNATKIEELSIDGEPGEMVEVLGKKGAKAGKWMPAVIIGPGTAPDAFDIRLPGLMKTHKDVFNVPGSSLRKADYKVEIAPEEDWPVYDVGDRAEVFVPVGDTNVTFNCTILRKGEFTNTYDVFVENDSQGDGNHEGVHAKLMKKIKAAETTTTTPSPTTTTAEPEVLNMAAFMKAVEYLRGDLTQVLATTTSKKQELRAWTRRTKDWEQGCSARDRDAFVSKLYEMGKASAREVFGSVPGECKIWSWMDGGGIAWDQLATCFQRAGNVSLVCANCPTKLLLHVMDTCSTKCQPMIASCGSDQASTACATKTGRCLECLQEPASKFMQCLRLPGQEKIQSFMGKAAKKAKAGSTDLEAILRSKLPAGYLTEANHLIYFGMRTLQIAWKAVMGRDGREGLD